MLITEIATVANTLSEARQRLTLAGCATPQLDAEVLLAHTLNKDRTWLYLYPEAQLNRQQHDAFCRLIGQREQRKPLAYIIGYKEFFALDFWVNQHVLVPRPETELLVETALELTLHHKNFIINGRNNPLTIADVGTGSGCIAISLAKCLTNAKIFAGDISGPALDVARQNAVCHQVSDKITFFAGDLLMPVAVPVDLIVSNPPYVSQPELMAASTMPEVRLHEPKLALDGGQNGLAIIKRLLCQAQEKLKAGGHLLIEIGAEQGKAVRHLAKMHFPQAKIQIKKDLAGLDRLLVVQNQDPSL